MTSYAVKELYLTLQGEGAQAGRAAVFCRFAGCNLWSGREKDRSDAVCDFCDTDFVGTDGEGGGSFATADALAEAIERAWRGGATGRFVVFTGGEPLLQLDEALIAAAHLRGFEIAVETNGTRKPPPAASTGSASAPRPARLLSPTRGSELKLVFPQDGLAPETFRGLDFAHFWLQPMDGAGPRRKHRRRDRLLPHPSALAPQPPDPQDDRHSMKITQAFHFEAAHRLPHVAETHRCHRLHGHSYRVELRLEGAVDPATGFVADFFDIEDAFAPLREALDHHYLNEIEGLENPTAELIAVWIFDRIKPALPQLAGVKVFETPDCWAEYEGP